MSGGVALQFWSSNAGVTIEDVSAESIPSHGRMSSVTENVRRVGASVTSAKSTDRSRAV